MVGMKGKKGSIDWTAQNIAIAIFVIVVLLVGLFLLARQGISIWNLTKGSPVASGGFA